MSSGLVLSDGSSVAVCAPSLPVSSHRSHRQPRQTLRCNELLFINAYLANGRNATKAYQAVHPKASYQSARKCASETLAKPRVQEAIAERIRHEAGITKELVESTLLQALMWAKQKQDAATVAEIAMDCAKLAGFLVEKREDVTTRKTGLTDEEFEREFDKRLHRVVSSVAETPPPAVEDSASLPTAPTPNLTEADLSDIQNPQTS